ncbi:hypothetical protein FHS23_004599 [Prauserella isguenensis]|uniref:DUF3800 domain-containing protein n=1 Tax=Prauserella isguenensis TaxID=1470180 RepID=A0A839S6P8_9PSEU|nr:DUF3800 domain-containing protein [Prauserella isguenensis]MBB3053545.1 hypothetical protein [Prauserella isguenensis]
MPIPSSPANRCAFADESFKEAHDGGYYVLAAAMFEPADEDEVREVLQRLRGPRRGGGKLHWNEMNQSQQHRAAKEIGALEGFHVVAVGAPVPYKRQERARAMCLRTLLLELHSYGAERLIMESRSKELNARDVKAVVGARYQLPKGTSFRVEHVPGPNEPLLWAADVVAGAVRASREDESAPFRAVLEHCVYEISVDTGC